LHLNLVLMKNSKYIFFISLLIYLFTYSSVSGQHSKLVLTKIESKALKNAIFKINTVKELAIYLPPSYKISNKKYPVVYYLPGFNSPIKEFIDGTYEGFKLKEDLDDLILNHSLREMIVVICDGINIFGGNFYTNSILTGNNEDYIVNDIVNFIDSNYRTIQNSNYRGISGNSMGGFGALTIAMKHPEIFEHCYAMSPGAFNQKGLHEMNMISTNESLTKLKKLIIDVNRVDKNRKLEYLQHKMDSLYEQDRDSYFRAFTVAYGTTFCTDTSIGFPFIKLPVTQTTVTNLDNKTFHCWKSGFGDWEDKIKINKNNLLKLKSLVLDCGIHDGWITKRYNIYLK